MKIRGGFVSNSSSTSFIVAVKSKSDTCEHCKRTEINILDLLEKFDGDYEETRLLASGLGNVDSAYCRKIRENGYDPDKKLPGPVCTGCGGTEYRLRREGKANNKWQAQCEECGVCGPYAETSEGAHTRWLEMVGQPNSDADEWEADLLQTLNKIRTDGHKLTADGYTVAYFDLSYHDHVMQDILDMGIKSSSIIVLEKDC